MGPGMFDDLGKSLLALLVIIAVVFFGGGILLGKSCHRMPTVEVHWR